MNTKRTTVSIVLALAIVAPVTAQMFPPDFPMFALELGPGWAPAQELEHRFFDQGWQTSSGPFTLSYFVSFGDPISDDQTAVQYLAGLAEFDSLAVIRGEQYDFYLEEYIEYSLFSITDRSNWSDQRRALVYGWLDQANFTPMVLVVSVPSERYDELYDQMVAVLGLQ